MKKTVYDFSEAVKELKQWYSPKELSDNLKTAALRCAIPDAGVREDKILQMQLAVLDVCDFLDAIKEMEVEQ